MIRDGGVLETVSSDANIRGARRFHEFLSNENRVTATTMQTVGRKGHDGFTLAVVTSERG